MTAAVAPEPVTDAVVDPLTGWLDDMLAGQFDAVFLGTGAGVGN